MSRDPYSSGSGVVGPGGGTRSPRSNRRMTELPTVDRSPSRSYASGRGSPLGRKRVAGTRSGNNSPEHLGYGSYHHHQLGSPYYSRDEDLGSPVMLEERGRSMSTGGGGGGHHRSRSASRPAMSSSAGMSARYTSLDRASAGILDHDREFVPIRERSRDRGLYLEDEMYGSRSARQSPNPHMLRDSGGYIGELQHQNNDLQRELGNLKKELELTNQKLGSSMHSIKTFWSPELKKERALRKEESTKYSLINEQLKLLNSENQKQSMMVRQLEEELRMRMRVPSVELQQQMEVLYNENEHLTREIAILRDTIKELELRIETQKQTLQARDESIKKLLEMLQNKGMDRDRPKLWTPSRPPKSFSLLSAVPGKEEERIMLQQMQSLAQKQLDELRTEVQRRDQELLAMSAKMKTLEEQHQDYQRHITVLKESLCAKEEHYNMLQADVEEMRQRLEEKNRMIEKKTQAALQAQQERNRMNTELTELKDHMDIKDRKISVLQRKVDLHEATKKLQAGGGKPGPVTTQEIRHLEEQKRQVEEQRRHMEERAKSVDQKARTIEEKERTLQSLDQDLKKRKAKMDQLEQQLQRSGGSPDKRLAEMQKALESAEKELDKAKEESTRSSAETERLLQLMQMTQEEQNTKERQIRELQDALKAAQVKLKQATTAQQQEDPENTKHVGDTRRKNLEAREKQITELEPKATTLEKLLKEHACSKKIKDARNENLEDQEGWKKELELKNRRIAELENELIARRPPKNGNDVYAPNLKLVEEKNSWRRELEAKDTRITQLEDELVSLKSLMTDDNQLTRLKRSKENEGRTKEGNESWKQEIEAKNRRIVELEQEMESLENFLREHADTESLRDLEIMVERKGRRIEELEDTVAEFEDFLKQNPDVKELHELRCQVTVGNRRIQELERWIQKSGENREPRIDRERIIELEEMVTQLEEYVRKHNVDGLKMKLQDRESKIEQLQNRVGYLEKELCKVEENCRGKETQKNHRNVQDRWTTMTADDLPCDRLIMDGNVELREKEQKMKKMEHTISEKDNKIQAYEQQIVESKDEITKLRKEVAGLKKELSEYDDIGVLKEEIRVRDERIQQLEDEVDSLERAFNERIDLEQIEELVNIIKEKEDRERLMSKDLIERRNRIEELSEALRESVVITSDSEKKWKNEEKTKKEALQRVAKLEQRITSIQSASALRCITCQPLLSKLQKYESRLEKLAEERTVQLKDLRQMKREALKAAVSEKDAHLALLELSGINNAAQSKQAEELKADRKSLLDTLKKEDERSIELSAEFSISGTEGTPPLLTRVLETSDDDDDDEEGISNDRRSDSSSPRPATRNGDSCEHSKRKTSKGSESNGRRDQPKIDQQDSR